MDLRRSLVAEERETVITVTDADELVRIWSAQKRSITKMRKNPAFTEVGHGVHGTTEWAEFTTPADRWSPCGVKRRTNLTKQQRIDQVKRLQAVRDAA